MRKKINEAVVAGEAWASAGEKLYQYGPHILGLISVTGLGTWFASGWNALAGQGWGVYPLVGAAFALALSVGFAALVFAVKLFRGEPIFSTMHPISSGDAQQGSAPVRAEEAKQPAVEFWLPSNWTPGFRLRKMRTHETTGEWIQAEEVQLRVVAKQKMQNVRFEIVARVRRPRPEHWEVISQIGSDKFTGTVPKGVEQAFVIMQRVFWQPPVTFENRGTQEGGRARAELETVFFPESDAKFQGELGAHYSIHINVFHDEGPEQASFIVHLDGKRYFPQSQITNRRNIEPIMGQ